MSHYNIARWYRSEWGRYTQADPTSKFFAAWADGANAAPLYDYGAGRPTVMIDPLGLAPCCDCPEQEWNYVGVSGGAGLIIGGVKIHGTFTCLSKPDLKVKVQGQCVQIGLLAFFNAFSVDFGIPKAGVIPKKACDVEDLFKDLGSFGGAGGGKYWGVGVEGDPLGGTGTATIGLGMGGGVGLKKCWLKPYQPLIPMD